MSSHGEADLSVIGRLLAEPAHAGTYRCPLLCRLDRASPSHRGHLGRNLLTSFEEHGWIEPAKQPRALTLTRTGQRQLEEAFQVDLDDNPAA